MNSMLPITCACISFSRNLTSHACCNSIANPSWIISIPHYLMLFLSNSVSSVCYYVDYAIFFFASILLSINLSSLCKFYLTLKYLILKWALWFNLILGSILPSCYLLDYLKTFYYLSFFSYSLRCKLHAHNGSVN